LEKDIELLCLADLTVPKIDLVDSDGTKASGVAIRKRFEILKQKGHMPRNYLNLMRPAASRPVGSVSRSAAEMQAHFIELARHHASKRRAVPHDLGDDVRLDVGSENTGEEPLAEALRRYRTLAGIDFVNAAFPHVLTDQDRNTAPLKLPYGGPFDLNLRICVDRLTGWTDLVRMV